VDAWRDLGRLLDQLYLSSPGARHYRTSSLAAAYRRSSAAPANRFRLFAIKGAGQREAVDAEVLLWRVRSHLSDSRSADSPCRPCGRAVAVGTDDEVDIREVAALAFALPARMSGLSRCRRGCELRRTSIRAAKAPVLLPLGGPANASLEDGDLRLHGISRRRGYPTTWTSPSGRSARPDDGVPRIPWMV